MFPKRASSQVHSQHQTCRQAKTTIPATTNLTHYLSYQIKLSDTIPRRSRPTGMRPRLGDRVHPNDTRPARSACRRVERAAARGVMSVGAPARRGACPDDSTTPGCTVAEGQPQGVAPTALGRNVRGRRRSASRRRSPTTPVCGARDVGPCSQSQRNPIMACRVLIAFFGAKSKRLSLGKDLK